MAQDGEDRVGRERPGLEHRGRFIEPDDQLAPQGVEQAPRDQGIPLERRPQVSQMVNRPAQPAELVADQFGRRLDVVCPREGSGRLDPRLRPERGSPFDP